MALPTLKFGDIFAIAAAAAAAACAFLVCLGFRDFLAAPLPVTLERSLAAIEPGVFAALAGVPTKAFEAVGVLSISIGIAGAVPLGCFPGNARVGFLAEDPCVIGLLIVLTLVAPPNSYLLRDSKSWNLLSLYLDVYSGSVSNNGCRSSKFCESF